MEQEYICEGCLLEMYDCYHWQSKGFDAGLDWEQGHCFLFVLNEKGEFIIE